MGGYRKHGSKHENKDGSKKVKKKNNKGPRKDKIHGIRKGAKGIASQYLTRAQSLKKLQVSLVDFRRLCILKGIYPRDPKKKPAGNDKTYYHVKDIKFLQHEPLMNKFYELKTFLKKYKRCIGREDKDKQKRLEERKPTYTLHHLVRERYPSFIDAVRDLDDALSMLSLFDALPATQKLEIKSEVIQDSTKLIHEFFLYVVQKKALRRCFASIKGYYFQAELFGETVTCLVPHKYSQELPVEVDYKVMSTFNEFYRSMAKFINFKLYQEEGWSYPPKLNYRRNASEMAKLSLEMNKKQQSEMSGTALAAEKAKEGESVDAATIEDFAKVSEEVQQMAEAKEKTDKKKHIFSHMRVFIQREVPFHAIYFVLKCGGAQVGWSAPGSPFKETDKKITHQIIDRPSAQFEQKEGREYVQPQWVLDSFNENMLLPIAAYLPDKTCPPHLSPFVQDDAEGYVPKQREILNKLADEKMGVEVEDTDDKEANEGEVVVDDAVAEKKFMEELEAEAKGVWASEYNEKLGEEEVNSDDDSSDEDENDAAVKKSKAEEEELERRKAMMPKKHKRLFQRIEKGEKQQADRAENLKAKRKLIKKGKKKGVKATA